MCELDCEESWVPKNCCLWTVVLEKTLESPLDCKEVQPVHSKWDQSWVFIGRTDVEAEIPILWPPDVKSWLIWKDSDAGKDWEQEDTQWPCIWVNSRSWWWTGRPGMLWFMGSQRVGHDWATELNWSLDWKNWHTYFHCWVTLVRVGDGRKENDSLVIFNRLSPLIH